MLLGTVVGVLVALFLGVSVIPGIALLIVVASTYTFFGADLLFQPLPTWYKPAMADVFVGILAVVTLITSTIIGFVGGGSPDRPEQTQERG